MSTTQLSSVHSLARCGVAVGVDAGQSMCAVCTDGMEFNPAMQWLHPVVRSV